MGRPGLRRLAVALVTNVCLILTVGACGEQSSTGSGAPNGTTNVSVGVIPIVDVAPLYLGIQKGFFSSRGLSIEPKPAQGGAYVIPIVLSEQADIGFSNVVSLLSAREKNVDLVSIANGSTSTGDAENDTLGVLVPSGSTLTTASDLVGKTVAVNSLNSYTDATIRASVADAGGDPTKVNFVVVPFPDMQSQLEKGNADAALASEPYRTQILAAGGRVLFNNFNAVYRRAQIAHWFVTAGLRQRDPELVRAFTEGIHQSMTYANDHPDEVRAVLSTYMDISPKIVQNIVLPDWSPALDAASVEAVGTQARLFGVLKQNPDVAGLLATA